MFLFGLSNPNLHLAFQWAPPNDDVTARGDALRRQQSFLNLLLILVSELHLDMSTLFPVPSTGAVIPALFLEARMLQEHGCDAVAQMGVSMTADQCNLAVMSESFLVQYCNVTL
ncbi:hypothetical protein QR680_006718 [Steinernema hermaphroditum]|uniref:Uncharacterized protein n=1 Tax=Steinernema hermaphroditum TaxID=289476 RepID=A0AA39HYN1_9BILA|nr:hypothetical protein QR680_006718 [Steinernema hermaphroditum]